MTWFFETGNAIALLGAALAVALPGIASAKGIGIVAEAGSGLLTEEPGRFSQVLILEVIPTTNGLYGFVIWFLAVSKIGGLAIGANPISIMSGVHIFVACLPIAFGGFFAGIYQARVAAAAVNMIAKRTEDLAKGILMAVLIEFYPILALLASFLMLNGIEIS